MLKSLLSFALTLSAICVYSFPCTKYIIDFGAKVMPGDLRMSWSINTGYNGCGFTKDDIHKFKFIVTVVDMFGEPLVSDTVDHNYFYIKAGLINGPVQFAIEELGNPNHHQSILIRANDEIMPRLDSQIDTINFYLLNGYFYNAMTLIYRGANADLLSPVKAEYNILFPENYPKVMSYFNSFLHRNSMTLKKMPTAEGFDSFLKALNVNNNGFERDEGFTVYGKVTPEGRLAEYQVIPGSDKERFDKVVHLLAFTNPEKEPSPIVIIVGRTRNGRKFTVVNERALTDQRSKSFKKEFPRIGGAIH